MSEYSERFSEILSEYRGALERGRKNIKPLSGIFGFVAGPGDDPCHSELHRKTEALTRPAAAEDAVPEDISALVCAVLQAEQNEVWPDYARLALIAAQRHTLPLVSRMNPESRAELAGWYEKRYPKRMRLPVQKRILEELKA